MTPAPRDDGASALRAKARDYLGSGWNAAPPEAFARYHATRVRRGRKVRRILLDAGALPTPDGVILDVGCSSGAMLSLLASDASVCIGMDLDASGEFVAAENVHRIVGDGERMPLSTGTVDVVVCNHIYEHTDDAGRLIDEIWRVLKPGGVCYFAGPSRWDLVEPHYRLPLLSWLPRTLADRYVRLARRGTGYPEKPLSPRRLRDLLHRFRVEPCMRRVLEDPLRYEADDLVRPGSVQHRIALMLARVAPDLLPGVMYLCHKPTE